MKKMLFQFKTVLNEDPDMVPKEAPLILLDSKSAMCMAKNGRDTKHIRHIARRMHFVRNGEKCKIHKIEWCERGMPRRSADNVTPQTN